jgi:hypothetical protein
VSGSTRKALSQQCFQAFEPQRSGLVKSLPLNDLTRPTQNCKRLIAARIFTPLFDVFSTINFSYELDQTSAGAMP